MTIDRYTKTVLTVIAVCLVYLCLAVTQWPVVSAAAEPQEVVIIGWKEGSSVRALNTKPLPIQSSVTTPLDVMLVGWKGRPGAADNIFSSDPNPVKELRNAPLPVTK
jgi:hypothetical protein